MSAKGARLPFQRHKRCVVRIQTHDSRVSADVSWYGDADDRLPAACLRALGLPAESSVICRDPLGCATALCVALPSGITQYLKFEKFQAHLANERTWLAWVRTALSALTVSLSILALLGDIRPSLSGLLISVGGGFVISVFTMFVSGWLRYARTRDVLMLEKCKVPTHLHRAGLSHQARVVFLLLALLTVNFLLLG
mmetsp:Transcript_13409/g.41489  ORF Transcript_13409/g.41489 Transcript_13409/m.41489 type:complete len:196 (-) Transcript_13409:799-1386(-)